MTNENITCSSCETNENITCSSCKAWKETLTCAFYIEIGLFYGMKLTRAYYEAKEKEKEEEEEEEEKEE